jgi:hypothetical protein
MRFIKDEFKERFEAWQVAVAQLEKICERDETGLTLAIACKAVDDSANRLLKLLGGMRKNEQFHAEIAATLKIKVEDLRALLSSI